MKLEELYDIVDKNGGKIGEATWTPIHTKGLLHQTVHGLVFKDEKKKEVLIKKRSSIMHQGPGLIEIAVAGHILSGFTPEKTINKELSSELFGSKSLPSDIKIKTIGRYFNNDIPNNHEIAYLFEIIFQGPFYISEESEGKAFWIYWNELVDDMRRNPKKYAHYSINAVTEYSRLKR